MRAAPSLITPLRFSTWSLRDPASALQALNERGVVLPLAPVAGTSVFADLRQWPYPQLGILSATLCGMRHGANAGPARAGPADHLYLGVTLTGSSHAHHRRRDVMLQDGESVLLSTPEGFTMTHPGQVQFLGLRLSRAVLEARLNKLDEAVMRIIRRDTPALALLRRYVDVVLNETPGATPELQEVVTSHVYELVALALSATDKNTLPVNNLGVRAARLQTIKADIMANLVDAELCVSAVAARQGVTPRYVHKLFADEGLTYSAFVLGQRLDWVHRRLIDPRFVGQSISALAFGAGFGDMSYFNRAFRRRYGATPSDLRRGGP